MSKQKIAWILVGIILLLAALVRFYRFEGFVTFLGDQGRDAIIAKRIVTLEHFPAIGAPSSVGMIYLGPFYYYLIAPFLLLFGFNPVGLAFGVTFMWMIGLFGLWYVMYKKYGTLLATTFLILSSFAFSSVDLSRFSWNPNLLPLFSFATFYFFYQWLKEKKMIFAILFGSVLSLSFQLHYLALLMLPSIALFFIYYFVPSFKPVKLFKQTVIAIGAFIFFTTPLILFDIKNNFLNSKNFIKLFTDGQVSSDQTYLQKLTDTIHNLIRHSLQIETTSQISFLIFLGIIVLSFFVLSKIKSRLLNIQFMHVLIYVLAFAALSSPRHLHYFGPIYLSLYLLISSWIVLSKNQYIRLGIAGLIVIIFLYFNLQSYPYFTYSPNNQISHARKVADSFQPYIKKQPIQVVPIPFTETDGHFRYFLEINGNKVLSNESPEQAEELYVMCFQECRPLDDPQWQIAAFSNKKLDASWKVNGVTIYKIIHDTPQP